MKIDCNTRLSLNGCNVCPDVFLENLKPKQSKYHKRFHTSKKNFLKNKSNDNKRT